MVFPPLKLFVTILLLMIRWWVLLLEGFLGDISHLIPSGGISCIPVFVWSCYSLVSSEQSQSSFFPGSISMVLAPSWAGFANPEPKSGCFFRLTGALSGERGSGMANLKRPSESKPVRSLHQGQELTAAARRREVCDGVMWAVQL